jgi:transcription antitermination factor NusG
MSKFEVGDRVIVTHGDFKGLRGVIIRMKLVGDGITVALDDGGREIKTREEHVRLIAKD